MWQQEALLPNDNLIIGIVIYAFLNFIILSGKECPSELLSFDMISLTYWPFKYVMVLYIFKGCYLVIEAFNMKINIG